MPSTGDNFTVRLDETHLGWGTHRYTNSRKIIYNEMYIKIPKALARRFQIYNSNYSNGNDILGINIFNCTSSDGFLNCSVKTAGSSTSGDIYAKNLQGNGNLKLLSPWANHLQIQVGDYINVKWISPTDILLTHISQ